MISIENISVGTDSFALRDVSFTVPEGAWAVFMGRTGSGKTTLLEVICGLRSPQGGVVRLNGVDVSMLPPGQRGIGYVPQDRALFHTMTVRENLAFGLRIRRWTETDIQTRVDEVAGLLGIRALLDRSPARLSGGEGQRVALGRALAFRPALLCLDEPLSALDDDTREEMRSVLRSVRLQARVTTLHVTHHHNDADQLADLLLTLREGKVQQTALDNPLSRSDVSVKETYENESRNPDRIG